MYISNNQDWVRYTTDDTWKLSHIKDCGKWTVFYNNKDTAKQLIEKALQTNITTHAKHTKGNQGVICFYASATNLQQHRVVINFLIENQLLRITNDLTYADSSFKFNGQSWSKQYGNQFKDLIRLSHFINLETGSKLPNPNIDQLLVWNSTPKYKYLETNIELKQFIATLDKFFIRKINNVFTHNSDSIDFNDKLMHLAPFGYNIENFYAISNRDQFLALCSLILNHYLTSNNEAHISLVSRVKAKVTNNQLNNLLTNHIHEEVKMINQFISIFNHNILSDTDIDAVSYLIVQSVYILEPEILDSYKKQIKELFKH